MRLYRYSRLCWAHDLLDLTGHDNYDIGCCCLPLRVRASREEAG